MITGADVYAWALGYWDILRWAIAISAVLITISSIDDLFIDLAYWLGKVGDLLVFWRRPPKQALLDKHPQKQIAIMVPAWQEADVIANMVANTRNTFDYERYHIFVGVYANDADTRREVEKVRQRFPNVHRADVPHDGPTSKADCLNWIVQNILLYEQRSGERFDVFLMHDAEDVVHPYGLKTVNWFVDDVAMIQMPVLSMDRKVTQFVALHYMDEFAEFHTKDLPVRSALSGMTPSAGVATAFHRLAMLALIREKDGQPFNTDSLTEDYDVGHRLSGMGFTSEFIRYHARVSRQRKAWFGKGTVTHRPRELVATKEFFPDKFQTSVRQKTRWMLGISLMGWRQLGWFGGLVNRYYLYRDRKALFTAPVGFFGYVIVIQVLGVLAVDWLMPGTVHLPPVIEKPWVWTLVMINFVFLANRILHRAWFTLINHGLRYVWLTPVRIVISNLVSFDAFWRAAKQYAKHLATGRPIAWDKTQHSYPSLSELQGTGRLGDTLRFWNHVSEHDLARALSEQATRRRPLGLLLLDLELVDDAHLAEAFAERNDAIAASFDPFRIAPEALRLLAAAEGARFGAVPVRFEHGVAEIALAEPLTQPVRAELERLLGQRGVKSLRWRFAPLSDVAFAIRYGWSDDRFGDLRAEIARLRAVGRIDSAQEAVFWRSIRRRYARMGDLLVRGAVISHADLQGALQAARRSGRRLGDVLEAGGVSRDKIDAALAAQSAALNRIPDVTRIPGAAMSAPELLGA